LAEITDLPIFKEAIKMGLDKLKIGMTV